jgi:hypothetical protein
MEVLKRREERGEGRGGVDRKKKKKRKGKAGPDG